MAQFPERPKNIFDDPRLVVWGEKNAETNKSPRAMFLNFNDAPRIRVYSSVESDKHLEIKLTHVEAIHILELVELVARDPEVKTKFINFEGFIPGGEKKRGVVGTILIGRASDGNVFIGATKYGWAKPQICKFTPSLSIKRVDKDGNPVPDEAVSNGKALAWCGILRKLLEDDFQRNWKYPERKGGNQQKPQGNGGYNNQQPQGQSQLPTFDEDILF